MFEIIQFQGNKVDLFSGKTVTFSEQGTAALDSENKETENDNSKVRDDINKKKEDKKPLKFWQIPLEIIRSGSVRSIIQSFETN